MIFDLRDREPLVITGAVRTPIGKFGGALQPLTAVDLGERAVSAALERSGIEAEEVDEVFLGHGRQAGAGPNPARQVSLRAGIPVETPATTVNQACASGLKSILHACQSIAGGMSRVTVAGGMESMSNTPYLLPAARWGARLGHAELLDGQYRDGFHCPLCDELMGRTAERLAEEYDIDRQEQDEYAARSQQRAQRAREEGWTAREIVPVEVPGRKESVRVTDDEHPRDDVTVESLARLRPVFKEDGSVHPGNSSGITDGAAAMVVMTEGAAGELGVEPRARILAFAQAGVDPAVMGIGPVPAVRRLLDGTGVSLGEIDLVELNEAFAAQVIAVDRELGFDPDRLNVDGGAIALGHPIGCTGARIVVTLLHSLEHRGGRLGLATLCVSGGMGSAVLVERIGS